MPNEITVSVTDDDLRDWNSDHWEPDANPVAKAVARAISADDSPYRERLPDGWSVDVLAQEDDSWRVMLCAPFGPPWNDVVTLMWWPVPGCGDASDTLCGIAWGDPIDDTPKPFSFTLE